MGLGYARWLERSPVTLTSAGGVGVLCIPFIISTLLNLLLPCVLWGFFPFDFAPYTFLPSSFAHIYTTMHTQYTHTHTKS